MIKKDISLNDIAGYATERIVWQMLLTLSDYCGSGAINGIVPHAISIVGNDFILKEIKDQEIKEKAFAAPETFNTNIETKSELSDIWALGALAFYAITGMNVFEGKGGETQTKETEVPRLSSVHASKELSALIYKCMSYSFQERPQKDDIRKLAQAVLAKPAIPRKKLASQSGKTYTNSLVKFWPEEMVSLILAFVLLISPLNTAAQSFNKSAIPNEMASLVMRCIDLRSSQNTWKVSKAMDRDMNWTMMDELPLDKNGECKTTDPVDVFGLNDIGFSILKRHGGVTNAGGRFRDGRDPRYKYSFIEITVKRGATVNYKINGREGEQIFAIVPFDKDANYEATIPNGKSFVDNGICYIQLRQRIKKNDSFTLTLKNNSGKNMAFALINYNSRNNE